MQRLTRFAFQPHMTRDVIPMKLPLKPTGGFFGFKSQVPGNGKCLVCSKRIGEAYGFIRLTSGALLYDSKKKESGGSSPMMESILSLWYHGPHPSKNTGDGKIELTSLDNAEYTLDIVEGSEGGQIDINFCSALVVDVELGLAIAWCPASRRGEGLAATGSVISITETETSGIEW